MEWKINLDLWETEEYNKNIEPVTREVSNKLDTLIGSAPVLGYKPVWVVNDIYYGMRLYTPIIDEYYKMGLTVGHLTYGKVAYQFARLMSTLYTDPRQITWFSNAMAHMTSFWFLDYFAEKWIDNPPSKEYEGAYEAFSELKSEKVRTAFKNIDIMLNLATNEWIREEVKQLDNNKGYAPSVVFDHIALELLPFFQDEKNWKLLSYLGKATKKPIKDINDLRSRPKAKPDFDRLHEIVPGDLKEVVEKIRTKLGV
jgi:hypothetical protein